VTKWARESRKTGKAFGQDEQDLQDKFLQFLSYSNPVNPVNPVKNHNQSSEMIMTRKGKIARLPLASAKNLINASSMESRATSWSSGSTLCRRFKPS
jgi:hypothetical protein